MSTANPHADVAAERDADGAKLFRATLSEADRQIFRDVFNKLKALKAVGDMDIPAEAGAARDAAIAAADAAHGAALAALRAVIDGLTAGNTPEGRLKAAGTTFLAAVDTRAKLVAADGTAAVTTFETALDAYRDQHGVETGDGAMTLAGKYGVLTLAWEAGYGGADATDGAGRWTWTYEMATAARVGSGGITQAMLDALTRLSGYDSTDPTSFEDEIFNFLLTDIGGAGASHTVTIKVRGKNEASVITNIDSRAGNEGKDAAAAGHIDGQIAITDRMPVIIQETSSRRMLVMPSRSR